MYDMLIDDLKDKYHKFKEQKEIYDRYKNNLSKELKYTIVIKLISDNNFWGFIELVTYITYELAETSDKYIQLLELLESKVMYDMGQKPFLDMLCDIGENKNDIAIDIYEKLFSEAKENSTKIIAGLILGGFSRHDKKKLYSLLQKKISYPLSNSILKAIMTGFSDISIPAEIFVYTNKVSKSGNIEVLKEFANFCLSNYQHHPKYFFEKIEKLIRIRNEDIAYIIFDRLTYRDILTEKQIFKLIPLVLDSNEHIQSKIVEIFKKYPHNFQQISEWIIYLINTDAYDKIRDIDWIIEELGKNNRLYIDYFIINYKQIEREGSGLYLSLLPSLFEALSKYNIEYSLEKIGLLDLSDWEGRHLFYEMHKIILGRIYNDISKKDILIRLIENLINIAKNKDYISYDLKNYEKKKTKKTLTSQEYEYLVDFAENLLNQLRNKRESYDFNIIHEKIKKYATLYKLVEEVLQTSSKNKKYTPLMWLGITEDDTNMCWSRAYLVDLNRSLDKVLKKPNGRFKSEHLEKYIKDSMSDEKKFWRLFSEFTFIGRFENENIIEIEPPVPNRPGNYFDLKIQLNSNNYYFEITYPEIDRELKLANGAVGLGNKSFSIIDKKYGQIFSAKSLAEMEQKKMDDKYLIAIDTSNSTIDEHQLLNSLYGSMSLTLIIDKKTGRVINQYPDRMSDSLSDKNQKTGIISGIIYFKKDLVSENGVPRILLKGDIIPNPNAVNKLSADEILNLKKIILK